jgi:Na+-driven multidrug efflux pump
LLPVAMGAVWLGVSRFGALGAAFASLLSVTVAATIVVFYVFRHFAPSAGPVSRSLARLALASALVWGLARLWAPSGLVLLPAYGLLGGLYLALLLALGEIRRQDLALVASWLPRPRGNRGV